MASEDDPDLEVKVTTTSDTSGIDEAEKSLGGFKEQAHSTSHALRELVGSSRHGAEIFRGLEAAGRGGASGVMEMVRGFRALILVVSGALGGPLSAVIITLGVIAGAFMALSRHSKEAGKDVEDTGKKSEEAAKKMEAIRKAVDEDWKPLEAELKNINEHFAILNKMMDQAKKGAEDLSKADKDLRDSQRELAKERELSEAKTPEEAAYIEKKYAAAKGVDEAKAKVNTADQSLLDAQTRKNAADDEAERTAKLQSEGQNKIDADAAELARIRQQGKRVVANADATGDKKTRGAVFDKVNEQNAKLEEEQKKQAALDEAAKKAQEKATEAALVVQNQQLVVAKEQLAAINDLAAALLKQKNVDSAEVTGGGETREGAEREGKVTTPKGAKISKGAAERAEAAENHRDAAAERSAEKMANGTMKVSRAIEKHTAAVEVTTGSITEKLAAATRRAELTNRQLVNKASFDVSP
jgi:DNA repair exonuclease SbcCD ATPase subunit